MACSKKAEFISPAAAFRIWFCSCSRRIFFFICLLLFTKGGDRFLLFLQFFLSSSVLLQVFLEFVMNPPDLFPAMLPRLLFSDLGLNMLFVRADKFCINPSISLSVRVLFSSGNKTQDHRFLMTQFFAFENIKRPTDINCPMPEDKSYFLQFRIGTFYPPPGQVAVDGRVGGSVFQTVDRLSDRASTGRSA